MRIGQLPSVSNSDKNDLIAIERGGKTYSVKKSAIVVEHAMLVIYFPAFSSLPQTISDSRITENHVLLHAELDTPSAQTGDWTVNTADGSVTVSGDIAGSTGLRLVLGKAEE